MSVKTDFRGSSLLFFMFRFLQSYNKYEEKGVMLYEQCLSLSSIRK